MTHWGIVIEINRDATLAAQQTWLQGLSADIPDMKPLIQAAGGSTAIHLYFSEHMPQDRNHAKYVEGQKNVFLHDMEGESSHNILVSGFTLQCMNLSMLMSINGQV